jgi:hypothetical protein
MARCDFAVIKHSQVAGMFIRSNFFGQLLAGKYRIQFAYALGQIRLLVGTAVSHGRGVNPSDDS